MPERRARPWVTYVLLVANVVMFGVELAYGADLIAPSPQRVLELGGSYPALTLGGEWWRLGSSMFLHFGIVHIAMNMLCLYQARVVESMFGHLGFFVIYVVAGLGGGVASLIANAGNVVSAGASGAVFGIYGAFGAKLALHRAQIDPEVWRRTARSLGTFLVLNAVIGLSTSGISLSAHIGGLIVGVAAGAVLLVGARAEATRSRRALALALAGIALTAVALISIKPDINPITPLLNEYDTVEQASATRWNAALARVKAKELTEPALADVLDRDVIAPYQAMRDHVFAPRDIPPRLRPLFHRLDIYTAARLDAWHAFVKALRAPAADRPALLDAHRLSEDRVAEARTAYAAALEQLK